MKLYLIGLCLSLFSITSAQTDLKELKWFLGTWQRTNAKPGRSGVEVWNKISDVEFSGKGISLKGLDTAFVEKLKIVMKSNEIFYVADVPGNKEPIYFKVTTLTPSSVTFENLNHDFPKKIAYELMNGQLRAVVSGNRKSIEYLFVRKH